MASSSDQNLPPEPGGMDLNPEFGPSPESRTDLDGMSTLQVFDLLTGSFANFGGIGRPPEFDYLRNRIEEMEILNEQARQAVEKLDATVKQLSSPANRLGTLLALPNRETALVVSGGGEFYCTLDPRLSQSTLLVGTRVLLNEAYAVVGDLGFDGGGPVAKIQDVLKDGRLRVGSETSQSNTLVLRSTPLAKEKLKPGLEVRLDASARVALEVVAEPAERDHMLERVPELPWDKVGGQATALEAIRDAIELPLLHGELFASYEHTTPKGILLHGPPGCGKTLIGKATAYNLTRQLAEKTGEDRRECFLHIKGPELLNMWVGESERQVREIFDRARDKAREGYLPFIFIDEAESLLGTRRAGRVHGLANTLVPMFCAEMDGIESLSEMVIILASNRADMIDPAILRPGRIDRKIRVSRPTRTEAGEIYRIYLNANLPLDKALLKRHKGNAQKAVDELVDKVLEEQFAERDDTRFLEVQMRSGRREFLHRGNLISGAIIASIVKRAKEFAIKRAVGALAPKKGPKNTSGGEGLRQDDLLRALALEYQENDIFPPSDLTEDWLKLVDYEPENVVRISPIRAHRQRVSTPVA
ncbi:MAG: AAA family ATPase [Verrucomicrobiota bacterium]